MRVTCIHLLKIVSDGNFNLLFLKNYLHLASAKFDPCKDYPACKEFNLSVLLFQPVFQVQQLAGSGQQVFIQSDNDDADQT